ncbi:MAG TPA: TadE/TadG family type IV pilus assembly protein, partial [Anaerolineales bacterium]|nr:TadE/TadG family type IV pilus assembly protein [Anaerolineales bacterium]
LLTLIVGIIEFGRLLTIYNGVSNASREAARYGAVTGDSDPNTTGTQYFFLDCAGIRAAARRTAALSTLADSDIVITYEKPNTSGGFDSLGNCAQNTQPSSSIQNGYRVVVSVSTAYAPIVPLVPIPSRTFTFTAARTIFPNIVGEPQCHDGADNDSDGQTDYPNDPGCATAADPDETTINSIAGCFTLTVNISPAGAGAYTTNPASDSNCPAGQYSDYVIVTVSASAGYSFTGYTGDATGTNPATTLSMTANRAVTASFSAACYTLTTAVNPNDGSTVSVAAPNCDSNADTVNDGYTIGTTVSIQANPGCQRTFDYWSGDTSTIVDSNASSTTIVMDGNKTIIAIFQPVGSYSLNYGVSDNDSNYISDGAINSVTSGDCPGGLYTEGLSVTISAVPDTNQEFVDWTADSAGNNHVSYDNPYTFTMASNTSLFAQFDSVHCHTLQINIVTNGGGTGGSVTTNPTSSVNCAPGEFPADSTVDLTYTANAGYTFAGWSGAASGTNPSVTVDMENVSPDPYVIVTATFNRTCYTLSKTTTPTSGGSISFSPASSSGCSAGQFYAGEQVLVTGVPASGYYFSSWSGAFTGSGNPSYYTMPAANMSLDARFNKSCVTHTSDWQYSSQVIAVQFTNYTGSTKNISQIVVTWGPSTGSNKLTSLKFGTAPSSWSTIWSGNVGSSPKTFSSWDSGANTGLLDGATKILLIGFNFNVSDYNVQSTTYFDGTATCSS